MNNRNILFFVVANAIMLYINYILYDTGFLSTILKADISYISYLILVVTAVAQVILARGLFSKNSSEISSIKTIGREVSDLVPTLGLLGTVIGFVVALMAFTEINISDPSTVQTSFSSIVAGMSTALYTTIFGIISSVYTRVLYSIILGRLD